MAIDVAEKKRGCNNYRFFWVVMGCNGLLNRLFWVANDYPIRTVVVAETYQLDTYELLFARNRPPDSVDVG